MKNAYLISAHSYYDQLLNLVRLLDSEDNDIFIHINANSEDPDYNQIKKTCNKSNIIFVKRTPIEWGDAGLLNAELILMEEAYNYKKYDYYHMLSVQDLPIKSNYWIDDFLNKNKFNNKNGEKYTNYVNVSILKNSRRRSYVAQKNYFIKMWRVKNPIERKFIKLCNFLLVKIQIILGKDRFKNDNIQLCYGQPWWSMSQEAVHYVITQKDWILSRFSEGSFAADEVAIQTVIYNSPLRDTLFQNPSGDYINLMKLDFLRGNGMGSPYIWKSKDYDELINSKCVFARKFDSSVDEKIIRLISKKITCEEE